MRITVHKALNDSKKSTHATRKEQNACKNKYCTAEIIMLKSPILSSSERVLFYKNFIQAHVILFVKVLD